LRRADRRAFRVAYAAWIFAVFAYFIPAATWNPVSRFSLTRAIVEHGSLRIDPYADSTGDRAKVGEHWYTDKAPGVSVLAVPAYALVRLVHSARGLRADYEASGTPDRPAARFEPNRAFQQSLYVCSLMTSGLAGTAIALLLFELLRRRATTRTAFLASSMLVVGSPLLPYSTTFYGHVPAAAFLLGGIVALDRRGALPVEAPPPRKFVLIAGASLALAISCEYLTLLPAGVVALWFLALTPASERLRRLGELALGAALPLALLALYHHVAFGAPWRTGYSFTENAQFAAGHAQGLLGVRLPTPDAMYGLTFGRLRGLFHLWPLLTVALMFAGLHALRRRDWAIRAGLAVLGVLFVLNSGYYMWWGGAAVGPRHLLPGIPILAAGLALALHSSRRWLKVLVFALALYAAATSIGLTLAGVEAREHGDLFRDHLVKKLEEGNIRTFAGASNLGVRLGFPAKPISAIPLLVWLGLGYAYLLYRLRNARAERRFG
jgi:hypothetical protein